MAQIAIAVLLKAISEAIKEAQTQIERHAVTTFSSHFEEEPAERREGAGGMRPKMIRLPIPQPDGSYRDQEIPLFMLMHHHSLHLEEVKMRMRVTGSWNEDIDTLQVNIEPIHKEPEPGQEGGEAYAQIELLFRRGDAPEGVSRLLTEHQKRMT